MYSYVVSIFFIGFYADTDTEREKSRRGGKLIPECPAWICQVRQANIGYTQWDSNNINGVLFYFHVLFWIERKSR